MGRISKALVPATRTPRAAAIVERQRTAGPTGGSLMDWAVKNNLPAADLAKAIEREAARTGNAFELLSRIGAGPDPTMGAPFAAWDSNRLTGAQMGPGAPASPFPLGGEPRQFQYRVGFNYPSPPDNDRGVDGSLLRTLADSFDLMRLCIEIRKNDMTHLEWDVIPTEKSRSKREEWMKQNHADLDQVKQFFEWPEAYVTQDAAGHWVRRGKVRFDAWLGALLEDFFVGDWLTIWPRYLRSGSVVALDRVDGMTIKPLLDLDGRIPEPPMPAYQQYLYGVPRASFTLDELMYRPRLVRNQTPFGFSHVEQMLVLINLALRFQMWETQAYTDSALPLGLLEFPENFSPDQIEAVVQTLNAAISGLSDERQKFHGVPSGTKWNAIKPFEWNAEFAQYIVEYTAAMFRLNAQKLGFMPGHSSGLGGKGFAEQQSQNDEDKATIPDARWVEGLMNEIIQRNFNRNDIEFVFVELQADDEAASIEADKNAIFAGLKSWDQALEERGEEPVGISEPFLMATNGVIYSVKDIQAIQDPESAKDYTRTAAPGLPIYDDGEDEPPVVPGGGNGVVPPTTPGSGGAGAEDVPQRQPSGAPEPATDTDSREGQQSNGKKKDPANAAQNAAGKVDTQKAEKFDTGSGFQPRPSMNPSGLQDELRRWKRKAVKASRDGRRASFDSDVIPAELKTDLDEQLSKADDVYDVRALFDNAIEKAAPSYLTEDEARAAAPQTGAERGTTHAGLAVRAGDTGRVLMLQRSIKDEDDPARGTWEFPGGGLEDDESPLEGAIREWQEETGLELPPGTLAGVWKNGIYEGHIYVISHEADVHLNPDPENRSVTNPDDPDGDDVETIAWWAPSEAQQNPALRPECELCDWDQIDAAVPDAQFKLAGLLLEVAKAGPPEADDDTDREQTIKRLTAAGAAALATHAVALYGTKVRVAKETDSVVARLHDHYRQAVQVGSRDAAEQHGIPELTQQQVDAIAGQRAQAQRENVRALVKQAAGDGKVQPRQVNALARGAKPAYEQGYGDTVTSAAPDAIAVWHTIAADPCSQCADRDGQVFTAADLPGWPGDGDFGGELCEGGPNDRCELEWRIQPAAEEEEPDETFAAAADLEKTETIEPAPGQVLLERGISALEKLADRPADEHHHHVDARSEHHVELKPEIDARSEHHHQHQHDHKVDVDARSEHNVTIEQPKRQGARIEKTKDGMRLVPDEE